MLTCVYHPINPMRVVESHEADKLKESGFWFDSPLKAKQYREQIEADIKNESKVDDKDLERKKVGRPKKQLTEK